MKMCIGKQRRLQQCSTGDGFFIITALDHRNNLRRALHPEAPELTTYTEMVAFKETVTRHLAPVSTAVLLDPEVGAAQAIAAGVIPSQTGLVVAVEATGYSDRPTARRSRVLAGWNVEKIVRMGGTAVKLLVYYHPDAPNAAAQEALVAEIGEACRQYEIPFFLEPLSFSLDPSGRPLTSAEKRQVVVAAARRLTPLGADVLKAEFPLDIRETTDEALWAEACAELTAAAVVPWTLLSAGVDFPQFLQQTRVACAAGASGVVAGRAVWKEAVGRQGAEQERFLAETAVRRMQSLEAVVRECGRPWKADLPAQTVREGWYINY
jgi:tagatose 1,6-diphosphate aldolase